MPEYGTYIVGIILPTSTMKIDQALPVDHVVST